MENIYWILFLTKYLITIPVTNSSRVSLKGGRKQISEYMDKTKNFLGLWVSEGVVTKKKESNFSSLGPSTIPFRDKICGYIFASYMYIYIYIDGYSYIRN